MGRDLFKPEGAARGNRSRNLGTRQNPARARAQLAVAGQLREAGLAPRDPGLAPPMSSFHWPVLCVVPPPEAGAGTLRF